MNTQRPTSACSSCGCTTFNAIRGDYMFSGTNAATGEETKRGVEFYSCVSCGLVEIYIVWGDKK